MMTQLTLKQLILFIRIVRIGSITDTATEMNISPSAVSKSLQILESILGVNLIQRTTRNITITPEGMNFYNKIVYLLDDLENTIDEVSTINTILKGEIRITCSLALGSTQLMKLFSLYKKLYPDVNLSIDLNDKLVNLNDGDFDIALRITKKPPDNFAIRKLSPINWIFCASRDYINLNGIPKSLEDLSNHDGLINPNIDEVLYEQHDSCEFKKLKYKNITVKSNSSLALLECDFTFIRNC